MLSASLAIAAFVLASATSLTGRVIDQSDQPVAGAVVRVSTAKPRLGPQRTCPSCYLDCGKVAVTGDDGRFEIEGVSDKLLFGLAAGSLGFQGQLLENVDPLTPDLSLRLTRLKVMDPDQMLTGRVVDSRGAPVSGVTITTGPVFYQSGAVGGTNQNITPATVTDAEGNFTIFVGTPVRQLTLKFRTPGFAPTDVSTLRVGRDNPPIKLLPGSSLMGRLVREGSPVGGLNLEVVQEDRRIGNVVTPLQVTTADEGTFRLDQLAPGIDYAIYSLIGQDHRSAMPVTLASAPASGMLADLGDIETHPAHRLTVKFRTEEGAPIPSGSSCYLSRRNAWHSDRRSIPVRPDALVVFEGVAREVKGLGIRVPGYEVAHSDPFCQIDLNRKLNVYSDSDRSITVTLRKTPQ
jgi:hypothetical protein